MCAVINVVCGRRFCMQLLMLCGQSYAAANIDRYNVCAESCVRPMLCAAATYASNISKREPALKVILIRKNTVGDSRGRAGYGSCSKWILESHSWLQYKSQ
jgi:hypothetical protein